MEKLFVFRNIAKWFRLIEICFALILFSWLYSKLPFVVKVSSIFIAHLVAVATSPIFIFTLFNSILICLFVKSGIVAGDSVGDIAEADLFHQIACFVPQEKFSPDTEEIVYKDKEMIDDLASESMEDVIRESQEEASEMALRRPEMEKFDEVPVEEELSSEEFKKTVENFIAKQMRFHKEEKMAIVACS